MESIKIDAFNTNLHGCRILCQGPFPKGHPPILDAVVKLREPFKKRIVLSKTAFSISKYLPLAYDAMFQVKDSSDWTLALTYMTYAPKPLLIITEDIVIPDGVWSKLNRSMTLVNFTSSSVIQVRPYDAIFFAPIEELTVPMWTMFINYCKVSIEQRIHRRSTRRSCRNFGWHRRVWRGRRWMRNRREGICFGMIRLRKREGMH
jgi:hypothetical protein